MSFPLPEEEQGRATLALSSSQALSVNCDIRRREQDMGELSGVAATLAAIFIAVTLFRLTALEKRVAAL